ncbi:MAG: hypothetical protein JNK65_05930 [Deltaproteobacteria bacterium]|nr:hypothetical protein [Deltaproteobacteria bacterium]
MIRGEVYYLYAFDVADEIKTAQIDQILSESPVLYAVKKTHTLPREFPFYYPLTIEIKKENWSYQQKKIHPLIRIYDVGVVSIMVPIPFEMEELAQLKNMHRPHLDSQDSLDDQVYMLCQKVVESLAPSLIRKVEKIMSPEAYSVFYIKELEKLQEIEGWIQEQKINIAALLAETESEALSKQQIDEIFRHQLSYSPQDSIIIDWDACLCIDLKQQSEDVIHVLELANLQLEELVLMDQRLDRYLDLAYEELEKKRSLWIATPQKQLSRLRRFRMDVAKITDEVSNISKFFGDWYLARIYMATRERFHLTTWRESIYQRLSQLDELYKILRTETNELRMLFLEVLIVVLFLADLILIFMKK